MNGNPTGVGINVARNNPKYVNPELPEGIKGDVFSYHAERVAIRRAGNCAGGVLYVVRAVAGEGRLSLPCVYCMKAIVKAGIKRVIFTTGTESKIGIIKI